MFSNELKNEMKKKFNLPDSIINSSKHYKIPKFVYKAKSLKPHKQNFNYLMKNRVISLGNYLNNKSTELNNLSKTQYFERKRENMNRLLSQIQRDKIDLLIDRAYNKINDNIREYNTSLSIPKTDHKMQLDYLPFVQRELIINHVMNKTQRYLPLINKKYEFLKYGYKEIKQKNFDEERKVRQMLWSHNFMQQKKLEEYEKIYRIKYLNTEQTPPTSKFKDELIQKDFDYPKKNKKNLPTPKNRTLSSIKFNLTMNSSQTSNGEKKFIESKNNSKNK